MRASQELRWKQRIKENEDRRRRYEEASKRLEAEEKAKAQHALEERRAERARMDDLMRNPAQAPAPARKPILRKGTGAVLRAAGAAGSGRSPRPATVPAQAAAAAAAAARSPSRSPVRAATASTAAERPRREWSEGLKRFIAGQRGGTAATQGVLLGVETDALSWQQLKLAAEAGFEELLRAQEAAAAAAGQQAAWGSSSAWRRPGMTRALGGGGTTAEAWPSPAQFVRQTQDPPMQGSMAPPAAETAGVAASSSSPPVSKWAARMEQASSSAAQPQCVRGTPQPTPANGSCAQEAEQQHNCAQHTRVADEELVAGASQQVAAAAAATGADAGQVSVAAQKQQTSSPLAAAVDEPGGASSNSSCASAAQQHACAPDAVEANAQQQQHLTAAAAQAAAALRASMDELHRSTEQAAAGGLTCPAASAAAAALQDDNPQDMPPARQADVALHDSRVSSSSSHSTDAHSCSCSIRPGSRCSITRQSSGSGSISPVRPASAGSGDAADTAAAEPAIEPSTTLLAVQVVSGREEQHAAGQCQPLAATPTEVVVREPSDPTLVHQPEWSQQQLQEADSQAGGSARAQLQQQQQEEGEMHGPAEDAAVPTFQLPHEVWPSAPSTADMAGAAVVACVAVAPQQQQQEQQQEQQQQAASAAAAAGDDAPSPEVATGVSTLDALLAEAKHLAALRKAVGAEFAAMGRSRVAAVMGAYDAAGTPSSDSAAGAAAAAPPTLLVSARPAQQQAPEHDVQQLVQVEALPVFQQPAMQAASVAVPPQAVSAPHNPGHPARQAAVSQQPAPLSDPVAHADAVPQPRQQQPITAVRAKLPVDDTDLLPLHQLGRQHEQQLQQQKPVQQLQQAPLWLPAQRQQPQSSQAPTPCQPGQQLSQLAPSWSGTPEQPLLPLQQTTGCSTPRRQLCITSNPLYGCAESSPPSPYEGSSLQQQAAQGSTQQQLARAAPVEPQRQQAQQLHEQGHNQQQQPRHEACVMAAAAGPQSPAVPGPGSASCSDVGGVPHAYWPEGLVSSYPQYPPAADRQQQVQARWGAEGVLTGSPALQEQPILRDTAQRYHPHWGYQHCPDPEPVPAAAGARPGAVSTHQFVPHAAYATDMQGQLHAYPAQLVAAAAAQHELDCSGQQQPHEDAASSAGSGGSAAGSSRFLSKLAFAVKSAVGRIAVGAPQPQPQQQQQAGQTACRSPAKPSCPQPAAEQEQGSYVAAALLAQQRAEVEAAEREKIRAAAQAAKQAAARRAAAERAEAQRRAAQHTAAHSRPVPVAIGSYARQQAAVQQQQQQQPLQVSCRPSVCDAAADEWAGGCCDQVPLRDTAADNVGTGACSHAAAAAAANPHNSSQQPSRRQACTPQAPPAQPAHRSVSPRRKVIRTAAAAAAISAAGSAAGVLSQATDQHPPVSRIPVAPGTQPSLLRPPQDNTAPRAAGQALQRRQQQQQQTAGAVECRAGSSADDDEWSHLERELMLDDAAAAAADGQGYWQQQQQQQHPWQGRLSTPPVPTPLQAVCGPRPPVLPRSQGMWAAVHAAATAAAAVATSKGSPQPLRAQPAQTKRPPAEVPSASNSSSSTLKARPIATGAVPLSTRTGPPPCVLTRPAAADGAPGTATARTVPSTSAAAHKPPCHPAQSSLEPRTATAKQPQRLQPLQRQQQQQHSRLSLEEASLLAELQQLDQRMHTSSTTDQQARDAPPSTAKLPALAAAGGSPGRARGNTVARAAAPVRSRTKPAPATAPTRWQGGPNATVVKLAAVRDASRGGSAGSSSSGGDAPPTSAHRQQQQPRTSPKQAKLVSMSRTAAAGAASTPQRSTAAAAASAAGSVSYPGSPQPQWGGPVGVMMPAAAGADPRFAGPGLGLPMMGHAGSGMGMLPGVPVGPQGYMLEYQGQLGGAAWPEGLAAGTAMGSRFGNPPQSAVHPGMHPHHAALLRQQQQQGLSSGWHPEQQEQPMWWPGQMVPPGFPAAGQPYMQLQQQQACSRGGYVPYTAGGVPGQQPGRPGSGMLPYQGMQGPYCAAPLTAPSGPGQQPPGSPLLPTLHYHETVMRHRTSSSGSSGGGGGLLQGYQDRGLDGGSGWGSAGSRWGSAGSVGGSHGSSRGQQQQQQGDGGWVSRGQEPANVWPPRGVGRSLPGGGMKAPDRVAREQQGDGDMVRVYNAQLLLS